MYGANGEPEKCDDISEMILSALYKRGRATTAQVRKMTGVKSRSIRYRIDKYLQPAGLVRDVGRKEHPGEDVRVFELTGDGQRYVSDRWGEMMHYAQRHEVLSATQETRDRLDLLHDRLDDVADRQSAVEQDFKRHRQNVSDDVDRFETSLKGNLGELRNRVNELEAAVEAAERKQTRITDTLDEHDESLDEHENRLGVVERVVEEAWARIRSIEVNHGSLEEYLDSANHAKTLVLNYSPFKHERNWDR